MLVSKYSNNVKCLLKNDITSSQTNITLKINNTPTYKLPIVSSIDDGLRYLTIIDSLSDTKAEIISYTSSILSNNEIILSGVLRGQQDTTNVAWNTLECTVVETLTAKVINDMYDILNDIPTIINNNLISKPDNTTIPTPLTVSPVINVPISNPYDSYIIKLTSNVTSLTLNLQDVSTDPHKVEVFVWNSTVSTIPSTGLGSFIFQLNGSTSSNIVVMNEAPTPNILAGGIILLIFDKVYVDNSTYKWVLHWSKSI